jgi:hypothetical protein
LPKKIERRFGVFLESRKSKGYLEDFGKDVVLGYFGRNKRSRFGLLFTENQKLINIKKTIYEYVKTRTICITLR